MIYSDDMTEVNGNGKRETGRARARRVMAEKLAEARKRIEQDEADLAVVLAALDARSAAAARRDLAIMEANERCVKACDAADEDAAVAVARWLGRGESLQAVAAAIEMNTGEVSRLRKLGDRLNAEHAKRDQADERPDETVMPAAQFDALVGSIDEPDPASALAAAGQGHALAEAEQRRAERDAS